MTENKDPVCKMEVEAGSAAATREYKGQTFYFCSAGCAKNFDADPARYVRQAKPESHGSSESPSDSEHCHHHDAQDSKSKHSHRHGAQNHHLHSVASVRTPAIKGTYTCPMHPEVVSDKPGNCPKCDMTLESIIPRPSEIKTTSETKTIYTCPMHPEIEQDHPGQCPKCGMTLEPKTVGGVDEQDQREIRSLAVKFWVGLALTVPVLFLAMGKYIPGLHLSGLIPMAVSKWLELISQHARDSLGGCDVFRSWLALHHQSTTEHVYLDRTGGRGGLPV